jgi:hypothetical protein
MTHTFKYQTTGGSTLPRPFIPLTLRYHNWSLKIKALVDSGADFCTFDGALLGLLAPDINLNTLEGIRLGGVGGIATGYVTHLEIGLEESFFRFQRSFRLNFHPMSLKDLPDSWVFSMLSKSSLTERISSLISPRTNAVQSRSLAPYTV